MLKYVFAVILCAQISLMAAEISIEYSGIRKSFTRTEEVVLEYKATGDFKDAQYKAFLDIDGVIEQTADLSKNGSFSFRFNGNLLKQGKYDAGIEIKKAEKTVAENTVQIMLADMWNPERTRVWLWAHHYFGIVVFEDSPEAREMLDWYVDKGFNSFVPGGGVGADVNYGGFGEGKLALFDYGLYKGLEMGVSAYRSLFLKLDDDDLKFHITRTWLQQSNYIPNPFNQTVAKIQDEDNIRMMEILQHFPGVKICYLESEFEDYLPHKVPLAEQFYRYPQPETTDDEFIFPGVIADTNPKYVNHLYRFQWGDSTVYMNENAARVIKQYRPDIKIFSDPLRRTLVRERMQGLDGVSTWTYTNPDPKYMLYVELLKNYAKTTGQEVMHTITLFNGRGSIAPADKGDTVMGPDRLVQTSWINLSRNTGSLCYYIGSASDPLSEDVMLVTGSQKDRRSAVSPYQRYPETFEALKKFNETVVQPLGPMISHFQDLPRRTAVLASESAFNHREGPHVASWYQNYYVMDFYALLAMNQIPADIIFDEDIRRGRLADYDNLFLIRCDTLTESVYNEILEYQKNGGKLYADKYLRAPIENIKTFDFDFGYRRRVNVNAIAEGQLFAGGGDTIAEIMSMVESTEGVTAEQDQIIMEQYAKVLGKATTDIEREIKTSSLNVVSNMLKSGGTKYLFLINDKRTYSDRFADCDDCKGILDKLVEQTVEVELLGENRTKYAYDILTGKMLNVRNGKINVKLDDTGGAVIALSDQKIGSLAVSSPSKISRGYMVNIVVSVLDSGKAHFNGTVAMEFSLIDPEGNKTTEYLSAPNGVSSVSFKPALNDATGKWTVEAKELFTGKRTTKRFTLN